MITDPHLRKIAEGRREITTRMVEEAELEGYIDPYDKYYENLIREYQDAFDSENSEWLKGCHICPTCGQWVFPQAAQVTA